VEGVVAKKERRLFVDFHTAEWIKKQRRRAMNTFSFTLFVLLVWTRHAKVLLVEAAFGIALPTLTDCHRRVCQQSTVRLEASGQENGADASVVTTTVLTDTVQAGEDGYSLLRRPLAATSWDPNAEPDFEPPALLDESKSADQQVNDAWWQVRQQPSTPLSKRGRASDQKKKSRAGPQSSNDDEEEEEEFNLLQRSLDTLDYPRVLRALQAECTTEPARLLVQQGQSAANSNTPIQTSAKTSRRNNDNLAHQPLLAETAVGAQQRYRAVQEMEWILEDGHGPVTLEGYSYRNGRGFKEDLAGRPPPLQGNSFAWTPIATKLNQGMVLEGEDIMQVRSMLQVLQNVVLWGRALRQVDNGLDFVELPALVESIQVNETLQELLYTAFDKDQTEGYRLSGTTFPAVGRLRARVKALRSAILDTLDGLLALPSMRSKLALESGGAVYSEVSGGRLVVPLDSSAANLGIVHDTSRSGKTVYVEPTEIVGPTNELRQAEAELRSEEASVWRKLTQEIVANQDGLATAVGAVGQLDLVMARYRLGQELQGTVPIVQEQGVIDLKQSRHPVLLLRGIPNVVGSDIKLGADSNQGLVLTGPNSGGKTIILKLLGLVALMARAGIPVPAEQGNEDGYQPRVDFFNPVLADIGDIQSVGGDLSTFSGHMLVCREVLASAGKQALVLMDEVGSGTDPAQGVAIAQSLLEALVDSGARVAITTHYMQLKQLAAADDRFAVGGMQFVNGRPTYRLLPGAIGESFALAVAERLQLPQQVLDRANELLDSETRQMGDLIRELEDQKLLLDQQAVEMDEKRKELARMEFEMKESILKMEKKQLTVRRDSAKEFAKKLEEKEEILEEILDKLKSDPSRKLVARSWNDIKFVKRDALNEAENVPSVVARKALRDAAMEEEAGELVPIAELREKPSLQEGDLVVVCKKGPLFAREGSVVKSTGKRVEVRVNNMNVALKLTEVALPVKNGPKPKTFESSQQTRAKSISKATERALANEGAGGASSEWERVRQTQQQSSPSGKQLQMKTDANTVDVRGLNLLEAQEKVKDKCSMSLMSGRSVIYILHGHGTGGVLKNKVRNWLRTERSLVKRWEPAKQEDGGDSHTRVELK
jgi:DNA mismatch repair protein MutS2